MKVLVVGSGGREHAIIRALKRSPQRPQLLAAPGNPGIAADALCYTDTAVDDLDGIVRLAIDQRVDLVVVGPEVPLVAGLADLLTAAGVRCFGPSAAAAALEGSKAFAKEVMNLAGVVTAGSVLVDELEAGMAAISSYPVVLKADGLAAGKGVVIAENEQQARQALQQILVERRFGTTQVLVEEFITGSELSLLAICDGQRALPLAPAQDYKRIFDNDQGPNTGGMGAYSPVPGVDQSFVDEIVASVHQPVVDLMAQRGTPFHGVLYAGLMLTKDGPKVLEFNTRFGDPETQVVLPRLETDLLTVMLAATELGGLSGIDLTWSKKAAVTLVLASEGYPDSPRLGDVITGLDQLPESIEVTHAGTKIREGKLVTAGGRVLNITAQSGDLKAAREDVYSAEQIVEFAGKQRRGDIALLLAGT